MANYLILYILTKSFYLFYNILNIKIAKLIVFSFFYIYILKNNVYDKRFLYIYLKLNCF